MGDKTRRREDTPIIEGVIPELDDIIREREETGCHYNDDWSLGEIAILTRYYGRPGITAKKLTEYLPGRSISSIYHKADNLGISKMKQRPVR